jgi:hypothetical protein
MDLSRRRNIRHGREVALITAVVMAWDPERIFFDAFGGIV